MNKWLSRCISVCKTPSIDGSIGATCSDAAKTLAASCATVRDEVELDKLTAELINVVNETMQLASVSLWLKPTRYAHVTFSKVDHNE
jgi:hypothetical protein